MPTYYFVNEFQVHERTYKYVQGFIPGITFARQRQNEHFGGFIIEEPDTRSFDELKRSDWVDGLQLSEGGSGIISIRGSDLYPTRAGLDPDELPAALIKDYDYDQVASLRLTKENKCCLIL